MQDHKTQLYSGFQGLQQFACQRAPETGGQLLGLTGRHADSFSKAWRTQPRPKQQQQTTNMSHQQQTNQAPPDHTNHLTSPPLPRTTSPRLPAPQRRGEALPRLRPQLPLHGGDGLLHQRHVLRRKTERSPRSTEKDGRKLAILFRKKKEKKKKSMQKKKQTLLIGLAERRILLRKRWS